MKKIVTLLVVGAMLVMVLGIVSANGDSNDTMTVKVNVLKSEISISVPSQVIFEDIAKGYLSERQDIDIDNTGTVDITVTPEVNDTEGIFDYLVFQEVLSDPMINIRYFSLDIDKPSTIGGTKTEGIYLYLDLTEYDGEIDMDMVDHESTVVFWAVPQ